jgi:Flp pilus assembly protein CpaB
MTAFDVVDAPAVTAAGPPQAATPRRRPVHAGWVLVVAAGLVAAVANAALLTADAPSARVAVVAARAPAGTPVEALRLDVARMPLEDPAAHLLVDPADLPDLAGGVTAAALEPGALLRSTDVRPAAGSGPAAMGLPIDPARAAGGLLQPGDRVDVLAGPAGEVRRVVRDVEVLSVLGGTTGGGVAGGLAAGGYALVLAVEDEDAVALAEALRQGDVDVVRTAGRVGR